MVIIRNCREFKTNLERGISAKRESYQLREYGAQMVPNCREPKTHGKGGTSASKESKQDGKLALCCSATRLLSLKVTIKEVYRLLIYCKPPT